MKIFAAIVCSLCCIGSALALNGQLRPAVADGVRRIFLEDAVRKYDWTANYQSDRVLLNGPRHVLQLQSGSRVMLVDQVRMELTVQPLRQTDGQWTLGEADLKQSVEPLLSPCCIPRTAVRRVVIDAGHGGSDCGAVRSGLQEKTVNLSLAERLMRILEEEGLQVVMTRSADERRTLDQRADEVRLENADIFISIHQNAAANQQAAGMEVYFASGTRFEAASMELAHSVLAESLKIFGDDFRKFDRGIRRAGFRVIRKADCPAILLECGFLSNADDRKRMQDDVWLDTLAEAIADGILAYAESMKVNTEGDR